MRTHTMYHTSTVLYSTYRAIILKIWESEKITLQTFWPFKKYLTWWSEKGALSVSAPPRMMLSGTLSTAPSPPPHTYLSVALRAFCNGSLHLVHTFGGDLPSPPNLSSVSTNFSFSTILIIFILFYVFVRGSGVHFLEWLIAMYVLTRVLYDPSPIWHILVCAWVADPDSHGSHCFWKLDLDLH
jgi:hypothetical protein